MSGESSPEQPSLDMDLSGLFLPAWAKESEAPQRLARLAERHEKDEQRPARQERDFRSNRGPGGGGGRGAGGNRSRQRDSRSRPDQRSAPQRQPEPVLNGWKAYLLPDPRGVEGLARQIKVTAKTYPLFDLALLILEKPERYLVELNRSAESAPDLFQLRSDGSVWLSEREAVAHALTRQLEKFYRRERVQVDPPKGNYLLVALCGMSGTLLGPPNYHDYQEKIRRLHAERYANMSFDAYKSRIRMVRDEESIQKWKDEQSSKDEFYPLTTEEGAEPVKLGSMAEVERHFRANHTSEAISRLTDRVVIPGETALTASSPAIRPLVRRQWEELKRFPLPLAHTLGQDLTPKGLQIFKAHQNITYVSIARPRYLDREKTPIGASLSEMINYLESHASAPRAEQWKGLLALRPLTAEGAEKERDAAVLRDLSWLLHEGHVTDYARRNLEAAKRQSKSVKTQAEP